MSIEKFNSDYIRLRKLLVRGQLNIYEAKLWLKEKQQELATDMVKDFNDNLYKWGRNANRDDKFLIGESDE